LWCLSAASLGYWVFKREAFSENYATTTHFPSQMGVDYYLIQRGKLKRTITKMRFTSKEASHNAGKNFSSKIQQSWHNNDEQRSQPQFKKEFRKMRRNSVQILQLSWQSNLRKEFR